MTLRFEKITDVSATDEVITAAADLFTQNYGVWGSLAAEKMCNKRLIQGARIKMSPSNLVRQILPSRGTNKYVCAKRGDEIVGNIFGTRWMCDGRPKMWVTQLCVKIGFRSQGIAKRLLEALHDDECAVGVLSSHPHAILAVSHVYGNPYPSGTIDLTMTRDHARTIMDSCPVQYVRDATLYGSLFEEGENDSVSCADTQFWVDHQEPLEALNQVRSKGITWLFGDLPEGHEFLIIVDVKIEGTRPDGNP